MTNSPYVRPISPLATKLNQPSAAGAKRNGNFTPSQNVGAARTPMGAAPIRLGSPAAPIDGVRRHDALDEEPLTLLSGKESATADDGSQLEFMAEQPLPEKAPKESYGGLAPGQNGESSGPSDSASAASESSPCAVVVPSDPKGRDDVAINGFTADARAALAELDAHGADHIPILLRLGEAASKAKNVLRHGAFQGWCKDVLRRSPTWVSAHRRLFEARKSLKPALAWAEASGHRWASCRSVERLLALIIAWERSNPDEDAAPPKPRRKANIFVAEITELKKRLNDNEKDFIALRDTLPPGVAAQVEKLAAADDDVSKQELADIAAHHHWRLRDLVETCGGPQVSRAPSGPAIAAEGMGPIISQEDGEVTKG